MRLILGSASPRRRELLSQIGVTPDAVRPADVDETPTRGERPRAYCLRVTRAKAAAIVPAPEEVVLTGDTTVAAGRRILGKPADAAEARAFLTLLSGRRHDVVSTVAVRTTAGLRTREVVTAVKMKRLSQDEMAAYLATGDWAGKAGGYAIQGPAAAFIPWIQGSWSAVVGLPLHETAMLLAAAGVSVRGTPA